MAKVADWIEGARIKTLPAAAAPVILGACAAAGFGYFSWPRAILAMVTAVALQIGANYSNDYSDGIRGTDDETRVGPQRLTGSGLASPHAVLAAALICWILAGITGFVLIWMSASWWLLALGAVSFVAAWYYTGGRHPYGYMPGVAEIMVFIFFGLFATLGTTWTQVHLLHWRLLAAAVGVGLLQCSLLLINNLRDIEGDTGKGKRTLCVVLGDAGSRRLYEVYITIAIFCALASSDNMIGWGLALILAAVGIAINQKVKRGAKGMELVKILRFTGLLTLLYGILVGVSLAINTY
ncbi:MAG: 1,4-dihydroxy-2-naphthoate polyprenyltransferase [Actinomycetaceae bacterium]|nr:1,4-dihydroxy-2-naphthoate polyprenyltransferase [Actinomycetaceae bacterium]